MKGKSMKYTLVKVVHFTFSKKRSVHVIKEADSIEEAMKYKLGAEMLEAKDSDDTFEILINVDTVFDYIQQQTEPTTTQGSSNTVKGTAV
jgi:transcriptional/translational regulatory protein YebC/TACO1